MKYADDPEDIELENKWHELEDIQFDEKENGELILSRDWWIFSKDTSRDDIWDYFDSKHSKGIYHLLYNLI